MPKSPLDEFLFACTYIYSGYKQYNSRFDSVNKGRKLVPAPLKKTLKNWKFGYKHLGKEKGGDPQREAVCSVW